MPASAGRDACAPEEFLSARFKAMMWFSLFEKHRAHRFVDVRVVHRATDAFRTGSGGTDDNAARGS
jgi:hypothetical protein